MYKPLIEYLTIKPSPIQGLGLFAAKDIPVGMNLGMSHIEVDDEEDYRKRVTIRTPLGGFYNHSEEPNCHKVGLGMDLKKYHLHALRNIKAGEEITVYYTFYKV